MGLCAQTGPQVLLHIQSCDFDPPQGHTLRRPQGLSSLTTVRTLATQRAFLLYSEPLGLPLSAMIGTGDHLSKYRKGNPNSACRVWQGRGTVSHPELGTAEMNQQGVRVRANGNSGAREHTEGTGLGHAVMWLPVARSQQ